MKLSDFLHEYRCDIQRRYSWAGDEARVAKFMASVHKTLTTPAKTWNHDSPCAQAAWRHIGGKGRASLAKLRALEKETP